MRLTTKTRYAVRAMVALANQPEGKALSLKTIAERQEIDYKYLEQIFLKLRQAGLIKGVKGPGGGYLINRDPKNIRISRIMEAVGETNCPVFCVERKEGKTCSRIDNCPVLSYWSELKAIIDSFFKSYTLEDIRSGISKPKK